MRHLKKPERPAGAGRSPMPARGGGQRRGRILDDWADGEAMPEGLGGVDPDYDRADEAVPPELRAQWRPSRFDGE